MAGSGPKSSTPEDSGALRWVSIARGWGCGKGNGQENSGANCQDCKLRCLVSAEWLCVTKVNHIKILERCLSEDYPELPDDDNSAFVLLEAEFRAEYLEATDGDGGSWEFAAANYMNKTLAAAKALNLDALSYYELLDYRDSRFGERFFLFLRDVDSVLVQIRVHCSRRSKDNSVGLTAAQKAKIHTFIEKIRSEVEQSLAKIEKKEELLDILAKLAAAIDKQRTPLARFGDLARGLAGISRDVAEVGAEPWWKWAKLIFGQVDEAKGHDPRLPKPDEIKKIEPPRKELPKPSPSDLDDEIPF